MQLYNLWKEKCTVKKSPITEEDDSYVNRQDRLLYLAKINFQLLTQIQKNNSMTYQM